MIGIKTIINDTFMKEMLFFDDLKTLWLEHASLVTHFVSEWEKFEFFKKIAISNE